MPLPSLLLLLGALLAGAPSALAQHDPLPDTLAVSAEAPRPLPSLTSPTRRCRDAIDLQAGERPMAQARCAGGFGLPSVSTGRRIAHVDAALHARLQAALADRLGEQRRGGE